MYNHFMSERRVGRFRLNKYVIENLPNTATILLSGMIIVKAEWLFYMAAVEYVAYSPLFEPVEEGCLIPEYQLKFNSNRGVIAEMVSA